MANSPRWPDWTIFSIFNLDKDVVDAADLRQPNTNQSLSSQSFTRAVVDVPSELQDYCAATGAVHADFQRSCEAFSCEYTNGQLILLAEKDITKRVVMLREFHMKNLQQKMRLAERMVGLSQTLAENKLIAESHIEKFVVDADLVRFAVGKGGVNIKRARFNHEPMLPRGFNATLEKSKAWWKLTLKITSFQSTPKHPRLEKRPVKYGVRTDN